MERRTSRPNLMALPCDLKERILKRLAIPDRIRLSAVNTSWHSAVTSANERYPPPPQLPWLMLLHPVSTRDHRYKFLNLSENKPYTLHLPHIRFRQYFGTGSHGWILAIDKNKASSARLLNPFTGAKISLPSLVTLPGYKFNPKWTFKVLKVEIGWGSGGIAERVLLLFEYASWRRLAFWRPGEESWNWLNNTRWEDGIHDILAYKGDFCIVSQAGEVLICRLGEDPPLVPMVDDLLPPHYYRWYLVASLNGELLLVGGLKDPWNVPHYDFPTKRFDIFKLNSSSGSGSSWEKVETLGKESLFLGNNASICLSVTDYPGWKENCIYFISNFGRIGHDWTKMYNYNDLHIFSLEDGSIKPLRLSIYHPTLVFPIWLPLQTLATNTALAGQVE